MLIEASRGVADFKIKSFFLSFILLIELRLTHLSIQ